MASKPIVVDVCDAPKEETYDLDFKSEINTIARTFPETITIDVPEIDLGWLGKIGGTKTTVTVRDRVKKLLDTVPMPSLEATFDMEGDCDDFEAMKLECTDHDVINSDGGGAQVVNVGVDYEFTAKVLPGRTKTEACDCPRGVKGKRKSRKFHIKWYLKLTMNPGVRGTYPINDFYVTVVGCCCCPAKEDEDHGEDGSGKGAKHHRGPRKKPDEPKGKPKRTRPDARGMSG